MKKELTLFDKIKEFIINPLKIGVVGLVLFILGCIDSLITHASSMADLSLFGKICAAGCGITIGVLVFSRLVMWLVTLVD